MLLKIKLQNTFQVFSGTLSKVHPYMTLMSASAQRCQFCNALMLATSNKLIDKLIFKAFLRLGVTHVALKVAFTY